MNLVRAPLPEVDPALAEVAIRADRRTLARRLWRGTADDGTDFGFELERPLRHGDPVWIAPPSRYVIRQEPEPVLAVALEGRQAEAALVGWAIGNLHAPVEAREGRLLLPDEPALRPWLDRLGIPYRASREVFRPHGFAGIAAGHAHWGPP